MIFGRRPLKRPCAGALANKAALEFGKSAEDLKDQTPAARRRVDRLGQRVEADLAMLQLLDGLDKLLERTRQPVELPHDERVARAQIVERCNELRPVTLRAGRGFLENPCASGLGQSLALQGWILVAGRDAGIADKGHWLSLKSHKIIQKREIYCKRLF